MTDKKQKTRRFIFGVEKKGSAGAVVAMEFSGWAGRETMHIPAPNIAGRFSPIGPGP